MFDSIEDDLKGRVFPLDGATLRVEYEKAINFYRERVEDALTFVAIGRASHLALESHIASHCRQFLCSSCCDARFKVDCKHTKGNGTVGVLERPSALSNRAVATSREERQASALAAASAASAARIARQALSQKQRTAADKKEAEATQAEENDAKRCKECSSYRKERNNVCPFCPVGKQRLCYECFEGDIIKNGGHVGERVNWAPLPGQDKTDVELALPCVECQSKVDTLRHENECEPCNGLTWVGQDVVDFVGSFTRDVMILPEENLVAALETTVDELETVSDRLSAGALSEASQADVDEIAEGIFRARRCGGSEGGGGGAGAGTRDILPFVALLRRLEAASGLKASADEDFEVDKKEDFMARAAAFKRKLSMAESHTLRIEQQKEAKHDAIKKVEERKDCSLASIIRDKCRAACVFLVRSLLLSFPFLFSFFLSPVCSHIVPSSINPPSLHYWQKFKAANMIAEQGEEPPAISCETFAITVKLPSLDVFDFTTIAPAGSKEGDLLTVCVTCASDNHDQVCQHSDRNLLTVRKWMKQFMPWTTEIILHSDSAVNYRKSFASIRVASVRAGSPDGPRVISWLHNEPGMIGIVSFLFVVFAFVDLSFPSFCSFSLKLY